MLQLNPQIPVHVVGKGDGRAIGWLDYSAEDHLMWIVALDENGEVWIIPNPEIRLQWNQTLGRTQMEMVKKEKKKEVKKKGKEPVLMTKKKTVHEVSAKRISDYGKKNKKK